MSKVDTTTTDVASKPKRGRPSKKQNKEEDKDTKMDIEKQQEIE